MGKMKKASRPWEVISIDFMGPYTRSTKGNSYLLVVYDFFSKYPCIFPIKSATANKVCELLENQVFLQYGVPSTIIADNGKQFKSNKFAELLSQYGVPNCFFNCFYHPRNNPCERENKVIISALRSYVESNQRHWDTNVNKIQVALRTAVNEITGFSPFFLNHGREFTFHGDDHILYSLEENSSRDPITNRSQFLIDFQKIIPDIMSRMIKSYERNKKRFDANKQIGSFNIGDIVYRRNFANSDASKGYAAKLGKLFIECVVTKKYSDLVYDLQDVNTKKIGRYHIKDIKPGTKNDQ